MIPVRAGGLLRAFCEAEVLGAADVQVALRLSRLGQETREPVLLAVALAVRGVRTGSVCVELATVAETAAPQADPEADDGVERPPVDLRWPEPAAWLADLRDSPLVAVGEHADYRPVRLVDGLLYLDRYWQQEQLVRRELDERAARPAPPVDLAAIGRLFPDERPDRQRLAVAVAASRWVSVITGGPGTGKTHTVARLLALLAEQPGTPPRVALAAPTGKAAARLQESVQEQAAAIGLPLDLTASTLHRLLGWRPDSRSRFRHHAGNHLPYDVVVVDESSMVSLTMMARLLEAVRPHARLVLVGDPDQLTSVEAGAVLSDLVHRPAPAAPVPGPDPADLVDLDEQEQRRLRNGVVRLRVPHRFGLAIGALADAVLAGDADLVLDLLHSTDELSFREDEAALREEVVAHAQEVEKAAAAGDAVLALELLSRHRLLCAHRHGRYGVSTWNERIARWTGAPYAEWYPGRPLLVTANDAETRLYNGDTGVVVQTPDGLRAAFGRTSRPAMFATSRLAAVQTVHAMTVHRSQGSQYDAVTVRLPEADSAILSRELLYTAVTRARSSVRVIGTPEAVRAAVGRPAVRASGLRRSLGTFAAEPPS